jgi:hypothetical protein
LPRFTLCDFGQARTVDWGKGVWKVSPPAGKFGTFHLALVGTGAHKAEFHFSWPRVFVGVDAYNDGPAEATITIRSSQQGEETITLQSHELRRIRTGWTTPSSQVEIGFHNADSLHFDNLAYAQP